MAGRRWGRKRERGRREEKEWGLGRRREGREGRELISSLEVDERSLPGKPGPLLLPLGDLPCPSEALPGLMRACDVRRPSITEMSLF